MMEIQWLIIYVTAVGSPVRAERGLFGLFLTYFGQFKALLCSWIHFLALKDLLESYKPYQVSINQNGKFEMWCNSCTGCPVLMLEPQVMYLGDVGVFWTMNAALVVEKQICDLKILS